jgi:23S rRNA (cytosine1962-C5)-methyltransferase
MMIRIRRQIRNKRGLICGGGFQFHLIMASITLKKGREKSLRRRHPWIFSGAVATVQGLSKSGETAEIRSHDDALLARAAWSPRSQIMARVWSFDPEESVSPDFFYARLDQAVDLRRRLGLSDPDGACRLVNAESDGLPGLIVDRYADYLVCQFLSAGTEYWKTDIVDQLARRMHPAGIYERSDVNVRRKEGLPQQSGLLLGNPPPDLIEIREGPCRFWVDIRRGHKTGFYLDQRDNRAATAEYAAGAQVLNCFAYTGSFGIWALKSGALRITNVDSSAQALELARQQIVLNGLDPASSEQVEADVFELLRHYRDASRRFDLIVLDPPKFVESRSQLTRSARGYKDINLLAFKLLKPGGILITFSCSGLLDLDLFQKIVADAALDAGRDACIIRRLSQPADHPTALNFPEGTYLKGLVCVVQ